MTAPVVVPAAEEAPGHEALRIWFEADKSRTYAGMARVLDVAPATVGSWCRADPARPRDTVHVFAIQVLTGIPSYAWLLPSESARLKAMSDGKFVSVFERPKRQQSVDERQMQFDAYWQQNAPQTAAPDTFDPDSMM